MAKQTINFGSPPLGIGGDTYKSAFIKCNENFDELYTATSKYATVANDQMGIYKDVASFHNKSSTLKGALVIHLPKTRNKSNTMSLWTIRGYNYTTDNGAWELKVGGYNYSSAWLQHSANLDGPAPFDQVQLGWATDHQVIILGTAATTWSYPIVHIVELLTGYSNISGWENVTIAVETVLTGYTNLVTPVLYGNNRVRAAEALLYSRNINGVAFNGTQDITVADGTKLPLAGGTMTGSLKIEGAAGSNPLAVRGVQGISSGGSAAGLYLNYVDQSVKTFFNGETHYILGGTYTGNAATATKLATPRSINGVAFDGTKDININSITGALSVTQFNSAAAYSFLNGSAAQSISTGGVLASNSYSDAAKVPTNGMYSKGKIQTIDSVEIGATTGAKVTEYHRLTMHPPTHTGGDWTHTLYDDNSKAYYRLKYGTSQVFQVDNLGNVTAASFSGNAASATKLQTARTINGESFNGTANISFHNLDPQLIPANANFNSYTTPGMYYCPANATASTLVNRPTGNAFSLLVERHAGVKQTVTEYMASGHKTYVRNMYANTWGPWVRVHTTIDAPLGGQFLGNQETKAIAYNAKNISENVTIPGDVNALSAGPIEINTGKTVTINNGATWTIV